MKYVAIGCDPFHAYSFFLPIVAWLWRHRIGYEPLIFLAGSEREWRHGHASLVVGALARGGDRVERLGEPVPDIDTATLSIFARFYAAGLGDLDPSDMLIVSDADMLPIRREFFHQHDPSKHAVALHYSNCYGDEEFWPACYVSMTVGVWREIMEIRAGDVLGSLRDGLVGAGIPDLVRAKRKDPSSPGSWFEDERNCSARIRASRFFPGGLLKIPREGCPPKDQLCRGTGWPDEYDIRDYVDCHSVRPGWTDMYWPKLRRLLERLCPDELSWMDRYRAAFWELGPDK